MEACQVNLFEQLSKAFLLVQQKRCNAAKAIWLGLPEEFRLHVLRWSVKTFDTIGSDLPLGKEYHLTSKYGQVTLADTRVNERTITPTDLKTRLLALCED